MLLLSIHTDAHMDNDTTDDDTTGAYPSLLATNKQYFPKIIPTPALQSSLLQPALLWEELDESEFQLAAFIEKKKEKGKAETSDENEEESKDVLQDIILYGAKDSIEFDMIKKVATMRGEGTSIGMGKALLTAHNIAFNWDTYNVIATGHKNEKGKIDPKAVFVNEQTIYLAEELRYNFKSQRGKAKQLFTPQGEAFVRTKAAKKDTADTYYIEDMHFTTCNHVKPHYAVKAKKIKYVDGKRIASGPFQFEFYGVPTPLGFFYGLFYLPTPKASGIIFPELGENPNKGFFLRDGGYYIYFNDYIDLAFRGSIYTKGTREIKVNSNYISRYYCKGDMLYRRTTTPHADELSVAEDNETEWQYTWHHETLHNKIRTLTADVDIRNSFRAMAYNPNQLTGKTHSKIRYTEKFRLFWVDWLPYTKSTSIAHNEDFSKDITNMTLPHIAITGSPLYPARLLSKKSTSDSTWYKDLYLNLYLKHTSEFQIELTNKIGTQEETDTIKFWRWRHQKRIWKEARYGFKHTLPVETNIKIFSYFNLNPFIKYTERWYFKRRNYTTPADFEEKVGIYRVWDWNTGAKLSTSIYGTHLWGEEARVQGIRHRIEPTLGFTYTPDFSKPSYEYYQIFPQENGDKKKCNRFENAIFGTPPEKDSAILTGKVDNNLELKVRDTSKKGNGSKKVPIFESLYIESGYDFLEKDFPLQDIKLGGRTHLFDNFLTLEYENVLDPYHYQRKTRIKEYEWQHGGGLGTTTKSSLKIGTSFRSKNSPAEQVENQNNPLTDEAPEEAQTPEEEKPVEDPEQYVEAKDLPWEVKLAYHRNYTYQIAQNEKKTTNHFPMSVTCNISKNWKLGVETDYDWDNKELVGEATKIHIVRDLHCWQILFAWAPLAKRQSYDFSIGIKANMLQDIKFPHNVAYEKL